ncbi:hypothetical protein M758_6G068700 [Ceratodon purpureus]|nr:hypothetical protein M758_6G068700 [Ceratodon purpureus]
MEEKSDTNGASPESWGAVLKRSAQPEEVNKVMKEQDGEVEAVPAGKESNITCDFHLLLVATLVTQARSYSQLLCAGAAVENHAAADLEPPLVPETNGKIEEDTAPASTEVITPELPNGVAEVQGDEVPVSTDWNSAPVSWTSAEPPLGLENGVAQAPTAAAATTDSGVLGSAPAEKAVEKPPPQVYNFYVVKVPRPVDRQGKAEINAAGQKWQDKQDQRRAHNDTVQEARLKRNEAFEKRKAARQVERDWFLKIREKLDQISPLREGLKKIKEEFRAVRDKSRDMPTSEEELDRRIAQLEWRIQHESILLKEEKQLMRDIKQLQSSRESVRANEALFAQVNVSMGQREDLESALKPLEADLRQLEAERKVAKAQLDKCDQEYDKLNAAVEALQGQLQSANGMMQEAYAHHRTLKDQEYLRMKDHYDNKRDIQEAKLLASKQYNSKDVEAFCNAQVERMLEIWNTNDEFRKNYVKDNEVSTVRRFGTLDGRSLGPDEARPVLANAEAPFSAGSASQQNGGRAGASVKETTSARAGKVEATAAPVEKEVEPAPASVAEEKSAAKRDAQKLPAPSPVVEDVKSKEELEREAAELKEQRRATEMAKAKEAEERKKRIAERAQAKAQAWAQKEAERKEKEKEKKARKKTAAVAPVDSGNVSDSAPAAESADSAAETPEPTPGVTPNVSSRQRKRGVTNTQKQAARVARASAPPMPVRVKQQKIFGMPLQVVVGAGVAALLAVLFYLFFRGNVWSSASSSGDFKDGSKFKARPDASSKSSY